MPDFIGTWRLRHYRHWSADGRTTLPLGEDPEGLLIYTPTGHMSGQIMRRGRRGFAGGTLPSGTNPEIREALLGYVAYFGTYIVDRGLRTVTHKVIGSWYPNYVGSYQLRHYEFEGPDKLLLWTPPRKFGEETRTGLLIWERVAHS